MGNHNMKTTIDLPDDLAKKAKAYAAGKHTTLRAVIEQGIRQVLRNERAATEFKLRDASVGGSGLRDEYRDADWARIREAAYGERGG
jgi:predicted transcriptional regulator